MIHRIVLFVCFVWVVKSASGQYFQYSQYNYALQRVNPATVAASDYASLGIIYRQQATGGNVELKSTLVSAVYPFLNGRSGKRWSGLGISILDDRANNIFLTQEASLSYAANIFLTRFSTLSLGAKALYQQKKLNFDGLFTALQYIPDHGFDRFIDNGENMSFLRSDFFTISSGLYWQQTDRKGKRVNYFGVSLFDFNKPDDSFLGTNSGMSSTWVIHGGFRIYDQQNLTITPEVLFTRSASNNVSNFGATFSYYLSSTGRQNNSRIDVLTKYVAGRSGILGLQWHTENFSVGCSRDFSVSSKNTGNTGAFEVGIELKKIVDHRMKRQAAARKKIKTTQKNVPLTTQTKAEKKLEETSPDSNDQKEKKSQSADTDPTVKNQTPDLTTVLRHKQDSVLGHAEAGAINHEPFVIEKVTLHFNFQFNSSALDEASSQYLLELSKALIDNEHLKIKLTGHTDNIGSARFNERLSLHRANSIKAYLIENGISPDRIATEGKGMVHPLNENKTDEDRAANRRVELLILYE